MLLIFSRHGQTKNGVEGKFEGMLDSSLTQIGIQQGHKLGRFCKENRIQKMYVSPMRRALETAVEVKKECNIKIIVVEDLREICYGEWEGVSRVKLVKLKIWEYRTNNLFSFVHPGFFKKQPGESYKMLYKKLNRFFKKLQKEKDSTIVVSHSGTLRCAKFFFENMPDQDFKNYQFSNNTIYVVKKTKKRIETATIKLK